MAARRLQALDHRDPGPLGPVGVEVPLPRSVVQAQLDGIHLELEGQLVHRRLEGEVSLRPTGRAIGVGRRLVGGDLVAGDVEVGNPVSPGEEGAGDSGMPATGRPVVVVVARPHRHEGAVPPGAKLDVESRRGRRVPHQELLLSR